jgi:hypothetical protein
VKYDIEVVMKKWLILSLVFFVGCFRGYGQDPDLRTVPVTNNPHIIPDHGGGMPGISGNRF